jgi:hypothetical protein
MLSVFPLICVVSSLRPAHLHEWQALCQQKVRETRPRSLGATKVRDESRLLEHTSSARASGIPGALWIAGVSAGIAEIESGGASEIGRVSWLGDEKMTALDKGLLTQRRDGRRKAKSTVGPGTGSP